MTQALAFLDNEPVGRREMLKKGVLGGGLVAAALVSPALTGVAEAKGGKTIRLDIDTSGFADFQGAAPGAFYVSGDITVAGTLAPSIGAFHCWGYIREGDELGVVNQEFSIGGRGKILIAGVESDEPRAVTGGTGDFRQARGQGVPDLAVFDFSNTGKFRIVFHLTGASGPSI